jgi:hypothetical protein
VEFWKKMESNWLTNLTLLKSDCLSFSELCCKLNSPKDFEITAIQWFLFEDDQMQMHIETLFTTMRGNVALRDLVFPFFHFRLS